MSRHQQTDQKRFHRLIDKIISEERQTKDTEKDLREFGIRVAVSRNTNVSDALTGMRIACGVAVVTQKMPSRRMPGGDTILILRVRFMPDPGDLKSQMEDLQRKLVSVQGVNTVTFKEYEGRPLVRKVEKSEDEE